MLLLLWEEAELEELLLDEESEEGSDSATFFFRLVFGMVNFDF